MITADVDAGPVLAGHGISACAFGTGAARKNGRFVMVLSFVSPIRAWADVGTPLVWAEAFHLLIGNAVIGLLEGWLLAKVFRLSRKWCIILMVIANYISRCLMEKCYPVTCEIAEVVASE